MNVILELLDHVYSPAVVSIVRAHISPLSMMSVRSRALSLAELITDLDLVDSRFLEDGTPFCTLLEPAILDKVFGSSRRRPGNYSYLLISCLLFIILALPLAINFNYESLLSWLSSARIVIKRAVRFYSKDFSKISIDHPEHAHMVSSLNMAFLPLSELEVAFADYYVTTDTCTVEQP